MKSTNRRALVIAVLASSWINASGASHADRDRVTRAKLLLDTYYGNQAKLEEAVALLEVAAATKPWSAELLVEAARATIMGGHVVRDQFRGGTIERELALLDEATKVKPTYAKPYILRSEAYRVTRRPQEAMEQLDIAKSLQPSDPWLWNGYGDLYWRSSERDKAKASWAKAAALANGNSEESRKAFVSANTDLARAASANGDIESLRRIAASVERRRHPEDAWALGDLSSSFFFVESFDEAIRYARSALKVMNYGVGRRWLATALYAKACEEFKAGSNWQVSFREARNLGFEPGEVVQYFQTFKPGAASTRGSILFSLPQLPLEPGPPAQYTAPQPAART